MNLVRARHIELSAYFTYCGTWLSQLWLEFTNRSRLNLSSCLGTQLSARVLNKPRQDQDLGLLSTLLSAHGQRLGVPTRALAWPE